MSKGQGNHTLSSQETKKIIESRTSQKSINKGGIPILVTSPR